MYVFPHYIPYFNDNVTSLNVSIILSVVSSDNARGERANLIIFEEYRMIKKDILDKVLRRFNGTPRQPKYLSKPEYAHLLEPNKEIYISSAFYKGHWSYEKFKSYVDAMLKGRDYFVCGLPYQLALEEGLLTQKQIDNEMAEADFDPVAFLMEMGCVWWGESEKAYYKLDDFRPNRVKSVRPFYPHATEKYLSIKNNKKKEPILKKTNGEIRLISADFAALGGHENDNTVFTCIRLLPKDDTYTRYVPFITSINGDHTENQAIALKRLYYDFDADYIVMDTQGNGVSLYDDCSKILFDQERDEEYPAWCAMNNEKLKQRALDKNAIPIIYAVTTNAEVNNEIAVKLKNNLSKGKIKFLENEIEAKDYLSDHFDFNDLPEEDKAVLLRPYIQTSALINESINLEAKYESGLVKVYETGSKRKDRWTSLAYGNHYADILEKKLIKQEDWTDISYDEYVDTF